MLRAGCPSTFVRLAAVGLPNPSTSAGDLRFSAATAADGEPPPEEPLATAAGLLIPEPAPNFCVGASAPLDWPELPGDFCRSKGNSTEVFGFPGCFRRFATGRCPAGNPPAPAGDLASPPLGLPGCFRPLVLGGGTSAAPSSTTAGCLFVAVAPLGFPGCFLAFFPGVGASDSA